MTMTIALTWHVLDGRFYNLGVPLWNLKDTRVNYRIPVQHNRYRLHRLIF